MILIEWDALYVPSYGGCLLSDAACPTSVVQATTFYDALFELRSVSRIFIDAIDGYPYLWRRMDFGVAPSRRALIWSKLGQGEVPMVVDFTTTGAGGPSATELQQYTDELCSRSHQWRELHLAGDPTVIEDILSCPAPTLDYVSIHSPWVGRINGSDALPFQDTATPRTVVIKGYTATFLWTRNFTSRIRALYVQDSAIVVEGSTELQPLLNIIAQTDHFTNLQELTIDANFGSHNGNRDLQTLPNLRRLHVRRMHVDQIESVFSCIQLPQAVINLDLVDTYTTGDFENAVWVAKWFAQHVGNGLSPSSTNELIFSTTGFDVISIGTLVVQSSLNSSQFKLRCSFSSFLVMSLSDTLLKHTSADFRRTITSLKMDLVPGGLQASDVVHLIAAPHLTNVSKLTIFNTSPRLATQTLLTNDWAPSLSPPFPLLASFEVLLGSDPTGIDELVRAIAKRPMLARVKITVLSAINQRFLPIVWERDKGLLFDVPLNNSERDTECGRKYLETVEAFHRL